MSNVYIEHERILKEFTDLFTDNANYVVRIYDNGYVDVEKWKFENEDGNAMSVGIPYPGVKVVSRDFDDDDAVGYSGRGYGYAIRSVGQYKSYEIRVFDSIAEAMDAARRYIAWNMCEFPPNARTLEAADEIGVPVEADYRDRVERNKRDMMDDGVRELLSRVESLEEKFRELADV